jgi:hypothetical protein
MLENLDENITNAIGVERCRKRFILNFQGLLSRKLTGYFYFIL